MTATSVQPTPTMRAMLRSVARHGDPMAHLYGLPRHARGAANTTLRSLQQRGLVEPDPARSGAYRLTELGRTVQP